MNDIFYYIQHAVSGGSDKVSIAHIIPGFLPALGAFVLWGAFIFYRGQKRKMLISLAIYFFITMVIPLMMYVYSAIYLGITPLWAMLLQFTMFLGAMLIIPPMFQRYSYGTISEYINSQVRVNNSNKLTILFPNKCGAVFVSWYFTLMFVIAVLFFVLWLYASQHQYYAVENFSVSVVATCGILMALFFVVIRLFPRCPYCKFGLLDFDFRFKPKNQEERIAYNRLYFRTVWNTMWLKPFSCRYCKAPFVLRKQDL